jgi:arylsulfatase A-like enzyme
MHQHAAMHGTPYPYDTHVPVFFYGPGIAAGRHTHRVLLTDVAATLSGYLEVPAPSASDGASLMGTLRN